MWLDRVTGRKVTRLPEIIESSRYVTMKPTLVNGHTMIDPGVLLVDDGTGMFRGIDSTSSFLHARSGDEVLVEQGIINSALLEFEYAVAKGNSASFLIPEALLNRLHLQPFDAVVKAVIDKGHFQEITRSPNMELVYEEHLLPVSRVKKFSASAGRHLAAHSECWQKRSFTGVVPRSLLALESEDEYNIYENRVFARLLDHLDRYLQRRCREVSRIEEAIAEAESFEASETLYFGLTHSVCGLWGEGFKGGHVLSDEAEQGQGSLQVLRFLLKEVRGLRGSKLYKMIPKGDDIGSQIRMTNTLTHDQHYRHVARLWHHWLKFNSDGRIDPKNQFQSNSDFAGAYCTYVEALIKRSLVELGGEETSAGFAMPSGRILAISKEYNMISLDLKGKKLTIVPVYDAVNFDEIDPEHARIIISPVIRDFHLGLAGQTASPLYFYTLEAMVTQISSWLSFHTVAIFSDKLKRLPSSVINILSTKYPEFFNLNGTDATLTRPLGSSLFDIRKDLKHATQDISVIRFLDSLDVSSARMDAMLSCPLCGRITGSQAFHARDKYAFEVSGAPCGHFWRIDKDKDARRYFVAGPSDGDESLLSSSTFKKFGRYRYRFELPQHASG